LTSLVSNIISLVIIFLIALAMGFRSSAGFLEWLAIIGILLLFTLALTWVAVIPGLKAKSAEGAGVYAYPLIVLPFISSAFVPTETMPVAVRAFADYQPITPIIETLRSLLNSEPVGNAAWIALAWCVGIMAMACFLAVRAYKKAK
jgi:ABC-2 type transport system permease protein